MRTRTGDINKRKKITAILGRILGGWERMGNETSDKNE